MINNVFNPVLKSFLWYNIISDFNSKQYVQ